VRGPKCGLVVRVIKNYERVDALVDDILRGVTGAEWASLYDHGGKRKSEGV
jgi:hypothetical protein